MTKKKYRVEYLPTASDDMDDIYSHIAFRLRERQVAKRQLGRLYQAVRRLDAFPERHQKVDWEPWSSLGVRSLPVDNCIIYYLVDHESALVSVVRVVYGGRNTEDIINDSEIIH